MSNPASFPSGAQVTTLKSFTSSSTRVMRNPDWMPSSFVASNNGFSLHNKKGEGYAYANPSL